jgi:hypothetical protein
VDAATANGPGRWHLPAHDLRLGREALGGRCGLLHYRRPLQALAKAEDWIFVRKPTCARLIISDYAHIDVPLYAIPDAQFRLLEKAAQARTLDGAFDARADSIDRWDALPSDCVLLAHREEDWVASDPRQINDWFVDGVTCTERGSAGSAVT